ncbi:cation:proton antiporter [Parabacteroides sp. Marseille-P3160]|uniref:cation:proton antiporter n=1 Tax=Parabacteroides sp. Marseille-P3160 TaxID=1917887 RepID=UPI0009BBDFA9|nr:cation:proton antiporter [Parabacteroides sp. Marseille-P3160]
MTHLPPIISDLAFMLIIAGIVTLVFKWLKQPVVLGYIIAGFFTGPYIDFFPTVADTASIHIWGEIGVIFLLFGMGLEFSFKKLLSNGRTGFICLLMIILGLGITGYFLGQWMGWGYWESLILGCMLCLSSTTIIVKGFEDPKFKGKHFTEVVFGILIFDDLFAILVMVFLGTVAVSRHFEGAEILLSSGKLIFFMVVWIVCGIFLVPTFLKKVRRWLNDETLLIVSLGLCLGMVVFATEVELSSALGAFIMGSILAETISLENIERVTKPIKDFFGAIFFVSVGMMMDPAIIVEHYQSIIYITLLVLVGKIVFTAVGARLSGESMEVSIQSGFSMAQVGEFAFIVAGTAITYRLTESYIYPIIIAVSILTTFTTPYLMASGEGFYRFMMKKIPASWAGKIIEKDKKLANPQPVSDWGAFLRSYLFNLIIFVSLGIAILVLAINFLQPYLATFIPAFWSNNIALLLILVIIAPILKGIVYKGGEQPYLILKLWKRNFRYRFVLSALIVIRYLIAFAFAYYIFWRFLDIPVWISAIVAVLLLFILLRSKFLLKLYWNMEYRFVVNFNQRLINERKKQSRRKGKVTAFDLDNESWIEQNLYAGSFKLDPGFQYENVMLKDTDFRPKYGLLIVEVLRNRQDIYFPNGDFILQANDIITVVGNILQINCLATDKNNITLDRASLKTIHKFARMQDSDPASKIKCISLVIDEDSGLHGKSLLQSEMGRRGKCFVVGIERSSGYEINPEASTVFRKNDIIWIVGNRESINATLQENFHCLRFNDEVS